ncbi:hypothetical protein C8N24_5542 [Solirubrobacter pauli]|uniref:Virginiamycin B lyase n=1 Tax=Solirubrobacter pauli TaxID=166793 RepID=A0A660L3K6_9ACTN|nr:hypothetical protein [Solirubrobacter pauli]RKQ87519.1 hypothetical protein C8N24_5542 [Solirubrobacter pauli]
MRALAVAAALSAPFGGSVSQLNVAPDGAAWVMEANGNRQRALRITPDGAVRATTLETYAATTTIGADGQLWFIDYQNTLHRIDAGGTVTRVRDGDGDQAQRDVPSSLVSGPDGALWTMTRGRRPALLRFTTDGPAQQTPLELSACDTPLDLGDLTRATDGAVWASDAGCDRLVRIAPTSEARTVVLPPVLGVHGLAADATGGIWFGASTSLGGHVDADGRMTFLPPRPFDSSREPTAIAVAPDGRPWFATGSCRLLRVNAAGGVESRRAPIPARELAFDAGGGLWLASERRVARGDAPTDDCDDRPPAARIRVDGTIRRGVRVTVDEDARGSATLALLPGGRSRHARLGPDRQFRIRGARGGTLRLKTPRRWHIERGDVIHVGVYLRDEDDNEDMRYAEFRVTR